MPAGYSRWDLMLPTEVKFEVVVYNLDSEYLTSITLPQEDATFGKDIENILGLPIKNQVIFVIDTQTFEEYIGFSGFLRVSKKVMLGYRPTTKTDVDYELYSRVNGSFNNIKISSKYIQHEIYHSKPFSTYLDLKLYIESKLNIPADLQVILRRNKFKKNYYLVQKNDEYLIDYMFNNCLFNGQELPRENVVELMVEESTRYVSDKDDIIKIKPIYIYINSQHESIESTKIMTFLPQEHIFTISEMKSKIERELGLPTASQIIYHVTDHSEIKSLGMNYADDLLHSVFDCFASVQNEVVLYLTCDCIGDEKSSQICKKYGIKILEVQIKTPSGNVIAKCKPTPTSKTFGSLKSIVEETHRLSIKKQLFYCTGFNILDDGESIWKHFGWRMVNSTCTIYLFMKSTESKDENEICERLDIPQISPSIVLKSLGGRKGLLKTNMDRLVNMNEKGWFNCLVQDINEKLQPPLQFVLSFCGEILDENHTLARRDWKNLCFREGIVLEEITFNLTFMPLSNALVDEFCEKHNFPTLKTLKIKFLTSEMDVDLRRDPMESIWGVKKDISKKKTIPARAIDIFFNGRKLNYHEHLMVLFVREYSSSTSLEIHVVINIITNVKINLKSPYTARLTLPVDYITLSGSKTFYNVKEEIASLTGIPLSQLLLTCLQAPDVSNESFIHDLVYNRDSEEIEVKIWKTVTIRVLDKYGNIIRHTHDEITYDDETVDLFLSRLNIDKRFKLQKKKGISRNTFLHDLSIDNHIELKEKDSYCKLM